MNLIKRDELASYYLIDSREAYEKLRPLLAEQSEEEKLLFSNPELLTHQSISQDTLSLLMEHWVSNEHIYCIQAIIDKDCAGFITVQLKSDFYNNKNVEVGEIVAIYVCQKFRRKGLAMTLMTLGEKLLIENGVHAINTSWLEGNEASRYLYEHCGYMPVMVQARKII